MRPKRRAIVFLAVFMLMAATLTGCGDRDNDSNNTPTETNQLEQQREQFHRELENPNRPPPERNPDGTIG